MTGADAASAVFGGLNALNNLFNTGYSVYQDQRNFDYQKELQKKQWEREDTAVQRRRADLEAAGLNPNLAAGSAASSSTVPVGSHNINPLDLGSAVGSALDMRMALEQIKQQKEITFQQKEISKMVKNQSIMSSFDKLDKIFDWHVRMGYTPTGFDDFSDSFTFKKSDSSYFPLAKMFDYNLSAEKSSADILAKTNYWKNANELLGLINTGTGAVGNVMPRFNFNNSQSKYQGTTRNWNHNYNYRQPFGWQ